MSKFAFVVEGEVGILMMFPDGIADGSDLPLAMQKHIAVLRTDPKVIEITEEYGEVHEGYLWDGTVFTPPVG